MVIYRVMESKESVKMLKQSANKQTSKYSQESAEAGRPLRELPRLTSGRLSIDHVESHSAALARRT